MDKLNILKNTFIDQISVYTYTKRLKDDFNIDMGDSDLILLLDQYIDNYISQLLEHNEEAIDYYYNIYGSYVFKDIDDIENDLPIIHEDFVKILNIINYEQE